MAAMLGSALRRMYCKGRGISLLVPFHCPDKSSQRFKNWLWLKRYWRAQLPGVQVVLGRDPDVSEGRPFSKAMAVNDAASRAKGDIFVIIDADGYVSADAVFHCAQKIRHAAKERHRLWYVPYRQFYRLNREASRRVIHSDPKHPYCFPTPPPDSDVQNCEGSAYGHWYGAMIQIMPRKAFFMVGGWDPRFRGWGGEDHAAMRAMDTLYARHRTLPGQVLHLWHPMRNPKGGTDAWVDWKERVWENQDKSGANDKLLGRYYGANGKVARMRKLVDEGLGRKA